VLKKPQNRTGSAANLEQTIARLNLQTAAYGLSRVLPDLLGHATQGAIEAVGSEKVVEGPLATGQSDTSLAFPNLLPRLPVHGLLISASVAIAIFSYSIRMMTGAGLLRGRRAA